MTSWRLHVCKCWDTFPMKYNFCKNLTGKLLTFTFKLDSYWKSIHSICRCSGLSDILMVIGEEKRLKLMLFFLVLKLHIKFFHLFQYNCESRTSHLRVRKKNKFLFVFQSTISHQKALIWSRIALMNWPCLWRH